MRHGSFSLGEAATKLHMIRLTCPKCQRTGQYRVDRPLEQYGPDVVIPDLRHDSHVKRPRRRYRLELLAIALLALALPAKAETLISSKLLYDLCQSSTNIRDYRYQACAAYIDGAWAMWIAIKETAHAPTCAMGETPAAQAVDWFKAWYEHAPPKERELPAVVGLMSALQAVNPRGCP
jgi:hypothetical protein